MAVVRRQRLVLVEVEVQHETNKYRFLFWEPSFRLAKRRRWGGGDGGGISAGRPAAWGSPGNLSAQRCDQAQKI